MKNLIKLFSIAILIGLISCNQGNNKKESNQTKSVNYNKFIGNWSVKDGPSVSITKNDDSTFVVREINGEELEYIVKAQKDRLVSIDRKELFYKQELPKFEVLNNGNLKFDCGTGPFELSKTNDKMEGKTFAKIGTRYAKNDIRLIGKWIETTENAKEYQQGIELFKDGTAKSINMHTLLYKKWWIEKDVLYLELESMGTHEKSTSTETYAIYKFHHNHLELVQDTQVFTYKRK